MDELAMMKDEELIQHLEKLTNDSGYRRTAPHSREAAPWETEIAYAQRELDLRRTRKTRHREYVESMRSEEVDESSLPEYQGNPPPTWL